MNVFKAYSGYYDLLYKDKDYKGEVEYITNKLKKHHPQGKDFLDFGCGTGKHARILARNGFSVTGVDISDNMIEIAKKKQMENVDFKVGDIRTFNSDKQFDFISALFHVVNYLSSTDDLIAAFKNIKKNLKKDGIFIFDSWYGPSVLTERPEMRRKVMENDNLKVYRFCNPLINLNENSVDVNYSLVIIDKKRNETAEFAETHRMRYLFLPEVLHIMDLCGLQLIETEEWMTSKVLGGDTFSACFVGGHK